jgi:hypothetical protein
LKLVSRNAMEYRLGIEVRVCASAEDRRERDPACTGRST